MRPPACPPASSVSAGGVLRYGIQLRFACPPLKPEKKEKEVEKEVEGSAFPAAAASPPRRRAKKLYLCGPIRVVFPQRW